MSVGIEERKIILDSREPPEILERLKSLGIPIGIQALQCGDIVVGNVLIERKTINDFYESMTSGRLWDQLYKMKNSEMKCMLVVIGTIPYVYKNQDVSSFIAKMTHLKLLSFFSYGVLLFQVEEIDDLLKLIEYLWNRNQVQSMPPNPKKIIGSTKDIKRDMLARVPGIGIKKAITLSNKSFQELLNMTEKDLANIVVDGKRIGKRAETLFKVLHSK